MDKTELGDLYANQRLKEIQIQCGTQPYSNPVNMATLLIWALYSDPNRSLLVVGYGLIQGTYLI